MSIQKKQITALKLKLNKLDWRRTGKGYIFLEILFHLEYLYINIHL